MARSWFEILSPGFVGASIKRRGLLRSVELGLTLAGARMHQAFFRSKVGRVIQVFFPGRGSRGRILYAFYDLAKAANGFDIVNFLVLAELERRKGGYEAMHVVIVPPFKKQLRKFEKYTALGATDYYARLHNIVIPACQLMPSVEIFSVCVDRQQAQLLHQRAASAAFPLGYTVKAPIAYVRPGYIREAVENGKEVPSLGVPKMVIGVVEDYLSRVAGERKVVTITLRESNYAAEKNSDLMSWSDFARYLLDGGEYYPIFIRDTEQITAPVPNCLQSFTICNEASLNLVFRTALYEESYVNLFVNNGPAIVSIFNKRSSYIVYKFMNPGNSKANVDFLKENHGIDPGGSIPGSMPWQKLVWEDDTFEVIEREFRRMCEVIERYER